MKKNRVVALFLCAALLLSGFTNTMVKAAGATGKQTTTAQKSKWPSGPSKSSLSSDSAIVMELSTGTILYRKNIHKQHYPASITKIMTALLAIENCKMNDTVVYSKKNLDSLTAEDSNIQCQVGEKMSVKDCLYALMLSSANETATALAEHIAGSSEAFAKLMNERAKQAGATDTHFANPNGLHDDNHYVTAYDMSMIMKAAIQYPVFLDVIHTTEYTIPANNKRTEPFQSYQRHKMLFTTSPYYDADVIGGKTGYTDQAGKTLVTYAKRGNVSLISVVMKSNGDQVFDDTKKLLDYGFDNFNYENVSENDSRFNFDTSNDFISPFSDTISNITVDKNASILIPKGISFSDLDTDVSFNLTDGSFATITYKYGDMVLGTANINYTQSKDNDETKAEETTSTNNIVTNAVSTTTKALEKANNSKTTTNNSKKTSFNFLPIILIVLFIAIVAAAIIAIKAHQRKLNKIRDMKRRYRH